MSNSKVSLISQVRTDLWLPAFPVDLQLDSTLVTQLDRDLFCVLEHGQVL